MNYGDFGADAMLLLVQLSETTQFAYAVARSRFMLVLTLTCLHQRLHLLTAAYHHPFC